MNDLANKAREISEAVERAENIGIVGHVSPDGDCIGSASSLYFALKKIHKNVTIVKNDNIPDHLDIMLGLDEMVEYNEAMDFDLFIILDCSSTDRTGPAEKLFKTANKTICIDHHASNSYFADINLVDSQSSSTCEIVYELVNAMGIEYDKEMANNTFVGILTDTNRFLYMSTDSRTHEVAARLLEFDIDKDKIMQRLYQSQTLISLNLSAEVIRKAKFKYDNKLALCTMTSEDLDELGACIEDLSGKIDLIRDIDTVELACTIREEKEGYKVSMRSKNFVDVSEISVEFGGGGHLRAAGFSYAGELEDLKEKLLERFDKIDWESI